MARKISALRWGLLAPAVVLVAACGYFGGSGPARSPAHSPPQARAPQPLDPAAKALAGMVEAVGPGNGQSPVEVRFSIRERPQIGKDDEIDYALVPKVPGIETIHVAFGALEGLQVVDHGPSLAAIKPVPGVPIFGSVTVRPAKAGLFNLTAAVGVQSPTESTVWPFRIPVIAAEGPTQTAANQP
jgi:hypothetical protein